MTSPSPRPWGFDNFGILIDANGHDVPPTECQRISDQHDALVAEVAELREALKNLLSICEGEPKEPEEVISARAVLAKGGE